ncbi:MAG: hypothetical protein ACO3A4_04060 [Silvanigrellaceae bacterium]
MKITMVAGICAMALANAGCIKKMGSQSIGGVYSCTLTKGQTRQSCTEFKSLSPNEVAYFKQKCDSDSSMDAANWQEAPCVTEARQGGCQVTFSDSASNISTSSTTWGYTASALSAVTAPSACEKNGGRVLAP